MSSSVSVEEAISKGKRMVTIPSVVVLFVVIFICIYLGSERILPFWIAPGGFVFGIIAAWLYWSVMITRWRLWAFENVRNVHRLKRRAVQERLIWKDGHILEKTEFRSGADKQYWESLQDKFKHKDNFDDDLAVPEETSIVFSKFKIYFKFFLALFFVAVGIFLMKVGTSFEIVLAGLMIGLGAFIGFTAYKQMLNKDPQIIINAKGIKVAGFDFHRWAEISNEDVLRKGSGKHQQFFLVYDHINQPVKIKIDELDTNMRKLDNLLFIYHGRFEKSLVRR